MEKTFPLNSEELKKLTQTYPTPFYLYDEKAIRENMRKFTKAFSIFPKFREHFAVKACPNPYIMKILKNEGCGADCSSLPELILAEKKIQEKRNLNIGYYIFFLFSMLKE